MTEADLISRARRVAELREEADSANEEVALEDMKLRVAIIDATADVLPLLASDKRGVPVRHRGEVVAWIRVNDLVCEMTGPGSPLYALDVAEAISKALDARLESIPRQIVDRQALAETMRVLTRLLKGLFK